MQNKLKASRSKSLIKGRAEINVIQNIGIEEINETKVIPPKINEIIKTSKTDKKAQVINIRN